MVYEELILVFFCDVIMLFKILLYSVKRFSWLTRDGVQESETPIETFFRDPL